MVCIYTVAESWLNPTHWYQTNVVSQVALHDELRKRIFIKKYVHVTTPEVYGSTDQGWINEEQKFSPSTPYAVSRACCDLHLMSFFKSYIFPVVFTRAANVYGPGQAPIFVVSKSLYQVLNNESPYLYDTGEQTRCFTYVDDAIEGMIIASKSQKAIGEVFNIGSNIERTMKNAIDLIIKVSGKNIEIKKFETVKEFGEKYEDIPRRIPNVSKAKEILKWEATTSLEEGIRASIEWCKENSWWLK